MAGTVATDSSIRVRVDGRRRGNCARRHPAAGGRGPGIQFAGTGPGRPRRRTPLLRRDGRRRRSRSSSGSCWGDRRGGRAHRDGAGHLLPARPRPGHPAGHRDRHRALGQQRHPRQGPARPGADAQRRHRPLRQDRHPDQGRARRRGGRRGRVRRRRGRALLALAAAVEADSEHPLARAIVAAARDRGGVPAADRLPVASPAAGSRRTSTVTPWRSAVRRCCASGVSTCPPIWPTAVERLEGARGGRPPRRPRRPRSSAPWRSRTRSGPSPGRPSRRCTSRACGW